MYTNFFPWGATSFVHFSFGDFRWHFFQRWYRRIRTQEHMVALGSVYWVSVSHTHRSAGNGKWETRYKERKTTNTKKKNEKMKKKTSGCDSMCIEITMLCLYFWFMGTSNISYWTKNGLHLALAVHGVDIWFASCSLSRSLSCSLSPSIISWIVIFRCPSVFFPVFLKVFDALQCFGYD